MKLVVFSDIHGNIYALEEALKKMEKYSPEKYLFLGDMAGYYYYQNECIELLCTLPNLTSIMGNHDDLFLKSLSDEKLLKELDNKYGKSYSMFRDNMTDASLEYLKNMQDYEKNKIFEAYHGSPNNYYSEYIYPDNKDLVLDNFPAPYLFLGHTHYLMDKYIDNTRVMNPGSIGQPRDINKPSFLVVDTSSNIVEFVRFDYNKKDLIYDVMSNQDNDYLTRVLQRKKKMKKINILITSIGGDIGSNMFKILQEQTIFKCLIIGTDIKDYVFCKQNIDIFYKVPKVADKGYMDKIINIINENKVDLIIPSSEYDIIFLNENRSIFEDMNVKLLINTYEIINSFLDKSKTSTILNNLSIATPNTFLLSEYNNELKFPLILKACKSIVSKDIHIINNHDELDTMLNIINNKDEYIIQSYIGSSDQEYTTTVYQDTKNVNVITFRRTLDGDKTGFAEIYNSEKLELYGKLIAKKFLLNGSINIQSRMYNDDFYIFEINPRISSTVYIRNHFYFKDLIWWICDLFNIQYEHKASDIKKSGIGVLGYTYNFYDNII